MNFYTLCLRCFLHHFLLLSEVTKIIKCFHFIHIIPENIEHLTFFTIRLLPKHMVALNCESYPLIDYQYIFLENRDSLYIKKWLDDLKFFRVSDYIMENISALNLMTLEIYLDCYNVLTLRILFVKILKTGNFSLPNCYQNTWCLWTANCISAFRLPMKFFK